MFSRKEGEGVTSSSSANKLSIWLHVLLPIVPHTVCVLYARAHVLTACRGRQGAGKVKLIRFIGAATDRVTNNKFYEDY